MSQAPHIVTAAFPGTVEADRGPLWAVFDPKWYRKRYRATILDMTGDMPDDHSLFDFWQRDGARHAHAPNRFFDEIWYRRFFLDVENGIRMGVFESGFQHYCETGHYGRSGHPLFSETDYFCFNQDLTPALVRSQGYSNGFDHYLRVGQRERRVSSAFFSPDVLRASLFEKHLPYDPDEGEFLRFLLKEDASLLRCSWYFDPEWYLERYPSAREDIASGEFASPLHHYLANNDPTAFSPNPFFDESFYLDHNHDVIETVRARHLRNGYTHFVKSGLFEGRSPLSGVNLPATQTAGRAPLLRDVRNNAFTDLVRGLERKTGLDPIPVPNPRQIEYLLALRSETLLPLLARTPLDFRYVGTPDLSVLLTAGRGLPALLETLASLHAGNKGSIQVLLVSSRRRADLKRIDSLVYGLEHIDHSGFSWNAWREAVPRLHASTTLLIEAGCHLFHGAVQAASACLDRMDAVGIAPQRLGADLAVQEAGVTLFRNGSYGSPGFGQEAFSPDISFRRVCNGVSGEAFLCQTEAFSHAADICFDIADLKSEPLLWLSLGLALRRKGGQVFYEPDFLLRAPATDPDRSTVSEDERLRLRRFFGVELRDNPSGVQSAQGVVVQSASDGLRVLVLIPALPVYRDPRAVRAIALCNWLTRFGAQPTLFVLGEGVTPDTLDERAECRLGDLAALGTMIRQRVHGFDHVWICGGPTLNTVIDLLTELAPWLPDDACTLDLRTLDCVAEFGAQTVQSGSGSPAGIKAAFLASLERETGQAWFCRRVVVQDAVQQALVEGAGVTASLILGDDVPVHPFPDFAQRRNILIPACFTSERSFDYQKLRWFMRDVAVRLDECLPEEVRLVLACRNVTAVDLASFTQYPRLAPLLDGQKAYDLLAREARLVVMSGEVDGTSRIDLAEAASWGLPMIMQTGSAFPGMTTVDCDPAKFAETIITLYQDEHLWRSVSGQAAAEAERLTSTYRETLGQILGLTLLEDSDRD